MKILEVLAPDPNNDGRKDPVILSFTPWFKSAGWPEVIQQLADKTKEDAIAIALKVDNWKEKNIGGTPKQAFKAISGDKSAVLQDIEMPGVDLNKQPPENNGQWIDQGRWWVSKEPMLSNGQREFAIKIDMDDPTTWPRPGKDKKCPPGWELDKTGNRCFPTGKSAKKEEPAKVVKPVNGKCEAGYKLGPNGDVCIPDGSAVIPAGETEEQKKARLKKEADAKAAEDKKKEDDKKKDPDNKGKMIWPAGGPADVNRGRPLRLTPPKHEGIDIVIPVGTVVKAPEAGKIIAQAIQKDGAGLYVKLESLDKKRIHIFMHLSGHIVRKGDVVAQGDELGQSGGKEGDPLAGNAKGAGHLHWGVSQEGQWVDPETLIK